MAAKSKRHSHSPFTMISSFFFPRGGDSHLCFLALFSILSLLLHHLTVSASAAAGNPSQPHFEGFDAEEDDDEQLSFANDLPLRSSPPPITLTSPSDPTESHHGPPETNADVDSVPDSEDSSSPASDVKKPSSSFEFWDEDEFEGFPVHVPASEDAESESSGTPAGSDPKVETEPESRPEDSVVPPRTIKSFTVEIVCGSFLIVFIINYFTGKKENENIALAWVMKFASKDSIFDRNFSLLGVGETDDSPLLLKEGQNMFKFYASGRRFCQGMLATLELKSRHDLISRLYNMVVPCKDEMTFEVYMNDDGMDQVVFAVARKKLAKSMHKEERDLQRFASLVAPPTGRKWLAEELAVVSESKEVAGDLITEIALEKVFGDKTFEKFGKNFISLHFSDQHLGSHKKMLVFKFALPDAKNMADMSRLVALIPYYIDLIGRYKLSSHARSKTEAARLKVAQEMYKELQNARQEALQKKKADQRKKLEEAEAKLSAEALRKKEAKERARQMKKAMPKMKMSKAH
ncbi:OLC1v1002329C1 [Oldenlandia corymbosa var. corymbosa]|uniref:OLC1v1002329C1 n=1 Tax=Oldenlandia corymbosa var. corymbosa TaxID=529605 RepID=A0AAV1D815_OLDCO|nr:OLC1v1002329C1 [Oldenlandia corymbosa var. corymbosa]